MSEPVVVRSFLYLDAERVRSLAAQLLGGVPETRAEDRSHELGGVAKAEAGLLKFIRASGEADYRYRRSSTETSSLHHQVYAQFEDLLSEMGALEDVGEGFDFDDWTPDHFADGAFFRARGRVQLADYTRTIDAMQGFPDLLKAFATIQTQNIQNELDAGKITQPEATLKKRELQQLQSTVKGFSVDSLAKLGRALYAGGAVRLKVHPTGAPPSHVIVGSGNQESMLTSLGNEGLLQSPDTTSWTVVGQMSAAVSSSALQPIPTGNAIEDAIEGMTNGFRGLVKTGNAATFPVMECTPIAVYRETWVG